MKTEVVEVSRASDGSVVNGVDELSQALGRETAHSAKSLMRSCIDSGDWDTVHSLTKSVGIMLHYRRKTLETIQEHQDAQESA